MKEIYLQNAFEFGTQLMNKLTTLKEYEYRCVSCDYNSNEDLDYNFNFEFASLKIKNKIKFSYYPENKSENCHFDVNIESASGEKIELKKLVSSSELHKVNLFHCDTYPGNFSDKVHGFVENIDSLLENHLSSL